MLPLEIVPRVPVPVEQLHASVPAAEEEDLLDELHQERLRQTWEVLARGALSWPRSADAREPEPPEPEQDEPAGTPRQVLGLVVHELGGTVLEPPEVPI